MKPKNHQKIRLTIDRLGIHGEGIGRWQGYTLFVDGPLPGEVIQAEVTETKSNYGRAKLLKTDNLSKDRVTPPCPLFGKCGGCQTMHMSYDAQLKMKQQKVIDAFERIGKIANPSVAPCQPSPKPLGYRNKIQLPIALGLRGEIRMGFYARSSHDLVDVEHCYIHCPLGEKIYKKLQELIKDSNLTELRHIIIKSALNTQQVLVVLVTNDCSIEKLTPIAEELMKACPEVQGLVQNINSFQTNTVFGSDFKIVAGSPQITEILCGLSFKISASSFFQVNPAQAEHLYQKAIELCALSGVEKVVDAFCGVGTLSLIASKSAKEVVGIECVSEAIEDAKENADLNGIANVNFVCGAAEKFLEAIMDIDVVILNPPRRGCEPELLATLLKKSPKTIVYISCDPATLARDVALLQAGYHIEDIIPFDMFPQTAHVETIVRLHKWTS